MRFFILNQKRRIFVKTLVLFIVPIIGAIAGLYLTKINQDLRQQASEGVYGSLTPTPTKTASATGPCDTLTCPAGQQAYVVTGYICTCGEAKKADGSTCSQNSDCSSYNCQAGPGGKYCVPSGVSLTPKISEGNTCGTTSYDRTCDAGLTCFNNKCVKTESIPTTSDGQCLTEGQKCASGRGYVDSSCGGGQVRCGKLPTPTPTTIVAVSNEQNIGQICTSNSQCSSGNCSGVGYGYSVCKPSVEKPGEEPKYPSRTSCREDCAAQGGNDYICNNFCAPYTSDDENLLDIGQAINSATFGTFANYVSTNIELNNEGLQGWARYTDPRALEANTNFGLVLTAEGALAYTGIGALAGSTSATTFGATANLVNTGYNAYQARAACANGFTASCQTALAYTGLAGASLGTSYYSLAAQSAGTTAQAAQLATQARYVNAGVSALEIGANTYQTYQACQGPNANSAGCLAQGALSVVHGLGSYGDLAYTGSQFASPILGNTELGNYNAVLRQQLEAEGMAYHYLPQSGMAEAYGGPSAGNPMSAKNVAGFQQGNDIYISNDMGRLMEQFIELHETGHGLRDVNGTYQNLSDFFENLPGNANAKAAMVSALEEVGNISDNTLPMLRKLGLDELVNNEQEYLRYNSQRYLDGLRMMDQPDIAAGDIITPSMVANENLVPVTRGVPLNLIPGQEEAELFKLRLRWGDAQILLPGQIESYSPGRLLQVNDLQNSNSSLVDIYNAQILLP